MSPEEKDITNRTHQAAQWIEKLFNAVPFPPGVVRADFAITLLYEDRVRTVINTGFLREDQDRGASQN